MSWEKKLLEGRRGLRGHVRGTRRCLEARYKIKKLKDTLRKIREENLKISRYEIRRLRTQLDYFRKRRDEYCTLAGIDY